MKHTPTPEEVGNLILAAKEAAITIKLIMDCYPNIKASDSHVFMNLMDAISKAEGR